MDGKRLLKKLDDMFGGLAVRLFPAAPHTVRMGEVRSILLIRPGGAGDAVLLIPTVKALQHAYPAARLDILAEQRNYQAFTLVRLSGKVFRYDRPREFLTVLLQRYDMVVDSEQWYRFSAVVARLCRAKVRIGFATNERRRLFTIPIPYSTECYEAESFIKLAVAACAHERITTPYIDLTEDAKVSAHSLLADISGPYVVVFPGASLREKCWSPENFIEVARFIAAKGRKVVVVGGRSETAVAADIMSQVDGKNLAGRTSLAESAAIVAGAEAVVSGDSMVLHLAAGLGVPTVALFGPTSTIKWAPRGYQHITIAAGTPCAPCARYGTIPVCRAATGCMEGITARQVIAALEGVLV